MAFSRTSDPVRDAEEYQSIKEQLGTDRDFVLCGICQGPIYKADDTHYGDDVYEFPDAVVCSSCLDEYLKKYKRECA